MNSPFLVRRDRNGSRKSSTMPDGSRFERTTEKIQASGHPPRTERLLPGVRVCCELDGVKRGRAGIDKWPQAPERGDVDQDCPANGDPSTAGPGHEIAKTTPC